MANGTGEDLPFERLLETLAAHGLDYQVLRTEMWIETARASALAARELAGGAGTEIDCALGGSLTIGRIEDPFTDWSYASTATDVHDFDACSLPENDGGEGVIDRAASRAATRSGRSSSTAPSSPWTGGPTRVWKTSPSS